MDERGRATDATITDSLSSMSEPAPSAKIDVDSIVADRYVVVRFIANGGMGDVYEAQDRSLQQRVALKTIRAGRADDRRVERFKREVPLARRVTHRNVSYRRTGEYGQAVHDAAALEKLIR